jgi:hypothetical protein
MRGSSKFALPESRSKKKKRVGTKKKQNGREKERKNPKSEHESNETRATKATGKENQIKNQQDFVV